MTNLRFGAHITGSVDARHRFSANRDPASTRWHQRYRKNCLVGTHIKACYLSDIRWGWILSHFCASALYETMNSCEFEKVAVTDPHDIDDYKITKKAHRKLKKVEQSLPLNFYSSYSAKNPLFKETSTLCEYKWTLHYREEIDKQLFETVSEELWFRVR